MDPQDMSDGEFAIFRCRQLAAVIYRGSGYPDYAMRVERGEADDCQGMRIAGFHLS